MLIYVNELMPTFTFDIIFCAFISMLIYLLHHLFIYLFFWTGILAVSVLHKQPTHSAFEVD